MIVILIGLVIIVIITAMICGIIAYCKISKEEKRRDNFYKKKD